MSASSAKILSTAFTDAAAGRLSDIATPRGLDVGRAGDQVRQRIVAGEELRAWDDLSGSFVPFAVNEATTSALRSLAASDVATLIAIVDGANPIVATFFTQLLPWTTSLCDQWVRNAPTSAAASIALAAWARGVSDDRSFEAAAFDARLTRIGKALAARPRVEEISLWWQFASIAFRFGGMGSDAASVIYAHAAGALARAPTGDIIQTPERMRMLRSSNSEIDSLLPFVAERMSPDRQGPLLLAYFDAVSRRLFGELHEVPQRESIGGDIQLDGLGLALRLDDTQPGWWIGALESCLNTRAAWRGDTSELASERAAYVGCAVCLAARRMADAGEDPSGRFVDPIFEAVSSHLSEWLWSPSYPRSARDLLPCALVHAAMTVSRNARDRVMEVARSVRDADILDAIVADANAILTAVDIAELRASAAARRAFIARLG